MWKKNTVGIVATLLLASCAPSIERLPVKEVLANAAHASKDLQSARFSIESTFDIDVPTMITAKGTAHIEGVLQDGGEQVHLRIITNAELSPGKDSSRVEGDIELITAPLNETFIKIHRISGEVDHPLLTSDLIGRLTGQWWRLPAADAGAPRPVISPDPQLLRAQSQVVKVISDRGFDNINDRISYHYETAIDPEKLLKYLEESVQQQGKEFEREKLQHVIESMDIKGELWIDAETFVLHRIVWSIANIPINENGVASLSFRMDLRDHNDAAPIELPDQAPPISSIFSLDDSGVTQLQAIDTALPPELEEAIIKKMLEGEANPTLP